MGGGGGGGGAGGGGPISPAAGASCGADVTPEVFVNVADDKSNIAGDDSEEERLVGDDAD